MNSLHAQEKKQTFSSWFGNWSWNKTLYLPIELRDCSLGFFSCRKWDKAIAGSSSFRVRENNPSWNQVKICSSEKLTEMGWSCFPSEIGYVEFVTGFSRGSRRKSVGRFRSRFLEPSCKVYPYDPPWDLLITKTIETCLTSRMVKKKTANNSTQWHLISYKTCHFFSYFQMNLFTFNQRRI